MRKAITIKLLGSLKATAKPYELRDTKLSSFLVRVQPSGVVSFIAQLRRAERVTLGQYPGCTLGRARKLAIKAINAAEGGASTAEVKALVRPDNSEPSTLGSFLEETYETWLVKNLKTGKAEAARLKASFAKLIDSPMKEVTSGAVARWRTVRVEQGAQPSSINRDLNTLKACFRRATEWGVIDTYPFDAVKTLKVDSRSVVRYLSADEESRLRQALSDRHARKVTARESGNEWRSARGQRLLPDDTVDHLRPMVLLSLNTGLRRGELFALRWRDLDLDRRVLTVTGSTSKSGNTRHLPLSDEAFDVLTAWQDRCSDRDGLIFPGSTGQPFHTLKTSWSKLLTDADVSSFRWHDMRHSFASKLVQAGVALNTVRALLGHEDIKMTLRYAHLAPSNLVDAMAWLKPASGTVRIAG
jgi:integrase